MPSTEAHSTEIVAIVDDNDSVLRALGRAVEGCGYTAILFTSAQEFLEGGRLADIECLITDCFMPDINGIELVRRVVATGHRMPIIVISADIDGITEAALKAGATAVISKQAGCDVLLAAVGDAIRQQRVR